MPPTDPHKQSLRKPRGQREVQRTGTRVALGLGVVFLVVVGGYVAFGRRGASPQGIGGIAAPKPRPDQLPGGAPGDDVLLGSGGRGDIDLMDKKSAGRQAGRLIFESLEPLEGGRYDIAKPQAWMFLKDGRTIHVRADSGNLHMPVYGEQPESGTIMGGVVIDLYPPKPGGARVDPAVDKPMGTLRTNSISFDATLGQLATPDTFEMTSEQADLYGTGIQALFNEPKQRLEYLKIARGDRLVFHKAPERRSKEKPDAEKPGASAQAAASPVAPVAPKPAKPVVETLYRMDFVEAVRASQGSRELTADLLQVWARMLDGKLPVDAIAEVKFEDADQAPKKPAGTAAVAAAPIAPSGPAPTTRPAVADTRPVESPLTLRWTGPCEITPLDKAPPELAKDSVAARFSAERAGVVTLADSERGAGGEAITIEYGATTGRLHLVGSEARQTFLDVPSAGRIESARLNADLVHGIVYIPSGGALSRKGGQDFRLTWGEQADLTFLKRDGALVNAIKQAIFSGKVEASDASGSVRAGFARADFVHTALNPNSLSRLILEDGVVAESSKSGRITADKLDVAFAPGGKNADPVARQLTATGHAVAENKGDRLSANSIEATLAENAKGEADVSSAYAAGAVVFTSERDGVTAHSDEMRADVGWEGLTGTEAQAGRRQVVDLMGSATEVVHVGKEGERSTIRGAQMRLNGVSQAITVFGEGSFDHDNPGKALVNATWTDVMSFDNSTGKLECAGDATAVSTPDRLTRDRIEAGRIKLALAPGSSVSVKPGPDPQGTKSAGTNVLIAEAFGSVLEREGGVNARVTSERFVEDTAAPEGRRRESLQYLEGPTIIADNVAGTLDVPGAGKLVLVDKRAKDKAPSGDAPSGSSLGTGDSRGDTLFEWAGSMHSERDKGLMEMHRNVQLTHRGLDDGQITTLFCNDLTATATREGAPSESALGGKSSLTSALATGAVFATSGPENIPGRPPPLRKELTADRVDYDAANGIIDAAANEGGKVTFFDPARASPVTALRLIWDLKSERIEIKAPGTVVVPR